ncbi:uncharacterized protein [Miscanthus floridulus]|uniref:uncharacterized protein n=1 Tax=Miscanthus floridulus TaxID=154761 RepID=UPI003458F18C
MAVQDPTTALFSLDDHSKSMEREGLDVRISTMLDALDQARGALHEIVIPTTQKAKWDRLFEEAQLRADMAAQLAAAQEREAKARRDAEEIHGMFTDLSARVKLEEEEAARIMKERDELLEKDAQASKRVVKVLKELETERDLRRKAENLGDAVSQRLSAENVFVKLEKKLAHVQRTLQAKSDEHDLLQAAIEVVLDALKVVELVETSPLVARVAGIMARVGQLEEDAFHAEITQAFAVAHSHYDREINLKVMSQGFTPVYEDPELDEMEKAVAPLCVEPGG